MTVHNSPRFFKNTKHTQWGKWPKEKQKDIKTNNDPQKTSMENQNGAT
jgi:hypothetical protein